jgi:hypothetical protein
MGAPTPFVCLTQHRSKPIWKRKSFEIGAGGAASVVRDADGHVQNVRGNAVILQYETATTSMVRLYPLVPRWSLMV